MSRSQQNQVFNTGMANSKQDQGNAQTAFTGAETGINDFNANLAKYNSANPYTKGGEFATDESNINAGRANADASAVRDSLDRHGKTSGENTSGYASNVVSATRQATLDEADAQAKSDAARLGEDVKYRQFGVDASKFPVQAQTALSGQNLNAADSSLGTAESAAKAPSVWDELWGNAQQGAKMAATAAAG